MKRPIAISLSPNTERDDVLLALRLLLKPIGWFDFTQTEILEQKFSALFGREYRALAVNGGRSAEYLILKTLGVGGGDEVVVQALTCVAVPNSVAWTLAKPVYADVGDNFNISTEDLREKLSERTKAIIVQHSFGIPADISAIRKSFPKRKRIPIIEDCALALGATLNGKKVGTLGDVAFFSFGRDKVISSVFGGMILCKKGKFYESLKKERDQMNYPSPFWLIQQLLHPIIFSLALPVYNFGFGKYGLGKIIIYFSQKLKLISKAVNKEEERGVRPKVYPLKMPGALSVLALNQLNKLQRFNKHRMKISKLYLNELKNTDFRLPPKTKGSIWVRYPIVTNDMKKIFEKCKSQGILLGDWYKLPVVPVANLGQVGYLQGSCKKAERLAGKILNLPTYPTLSLNDARRVVSLVKSIKYE